MKICPNCGEQNNENNKFCRECGHELNDENQNNPYEEYNPAYGKVTRIIEKKLDNSKLVDKFIDVTTPHTPKIQEKLEKLGLHGEKYLSSIEPEFLEVYNTVEDEFLKTLFLLERSKHAGGGTAGLAIVTTVSTPTTGLSYEESIKFYETMLKKVSEELELEKQKPNFNEMEYYKKKNKEFLVENLSNLGVPRHLRSKLLI